MDHDMIAVSRSDNPMQTQQQIPVGSQVNPQGFFADTSDAAACSVAVAVRIRPLIGKELRQGDKICVDAREDDQQIVMGKDRVFTFDKTFGIDSQQAVVFDTCVKNLVLGCFEGFNATILAYGQTGSGKTFTMGSGYTIGVKEEDLGIIPRVIRMIFDEKEARQNKAEVIIKCSFLEIYNEELHDLLERNMSSSTMIDKIMPQKKEISIREEKNGTISVYGLKEMTVNSAEEMAGCLDMGSSQRVTACTLMNSSSSRSHGIFTISIEQHMIEDLLVTGGPSQNGSNKQQSQQQDKPDEYMMAKFHFVDLAGSERAKSTGATGDVFKEGVNINKGLLALGNVIASLTDPSKHGHVPYRDSKLTRILQDSLGGNSRTVMIAACSPAECNFGETLNTLKYAYRAKSIKNKPIVNRDPASQQIAQLRQMVYELQKELLGSRKLLLSNDIQFEENIVLPEETALEKMGAQIQNSSKAMGIVPIKGLGDAVGHAGAGASAAEVKRLEQQVQELKAQLSSKDKEIKTRNSAYDALSDQHQQAQIAQFELQRDCDFLKYSIEELVKRLKQRNLFEEIVREINDGHMPKQPDDGGVTIFDSVFGNAGPTVLEEYQRKVEETQKELQEAQLQLSQLQTDNQQLIEQARRDTSSLEEKEIELEKHRRQVSNLTKEVSVLKNDLRASKGTNSSAPPSKPSGFQSSFASQNRKTALAATFNPGMLRRNQTLTMKSSNGEYADTTRWLDDDFAHAKIKNFDEMRENFIEDLTNQFSSLLVPNYQRDRHASVKLPPRSGPSLAVGDDKNDQEMIDESEERKLEGPDAASTGALSEKLESSNEEASDDSSGMIPDEKPEEVQDTVGDQTAIMEIDILDQINNLESEEKHLDEEMKQKEALLSKIKEQQKEMQDALLKEMREEYHKKISVMAEEIRRLDTEKVQSLQQSTGNAQKGRIEEQFRKKEVELKAKLKELEKKQQEQTRLTKALNQQKLKTQSMEQEITKMKTQKVTMMKRIKEETENRARIQKAQAKERADLKRKIARQQRELDTIKREKNKADIQAKRKHEEVVAMQKRAKMDQQRKANATKMRQEAKQVDTTKIREWILENTEKMVDYHFLQIDKVKDQNQCSEIDQKIEEESRQYARLTVECDKLLQRQARLQLLPEGTHDDDIYSTEQEVKETQDQIAAIRETIKSYEEEQSFIQHKITQRSKMLIEVRPNGVDSMVFDDVQTLEGARACISTFFQLLLDSNLQLRESEEEIDQQKKHLQYLKSEVQEVDNLRQQEERQKELEIESLHQEYQEKERKLVKFILDKTNINIDLEGGEEQLDQINLLDLIDLFIKQIKASNDSQYDELMTLHEKDIAQNSKNEGLKRAVGAKVESREAKKEQYNANKALLAKRNNELEKKLLESEIAHKRIQKQLEQANVDKARFKRMYEEEKRKRGADQLENPLALSTSNMGSAIGHSLKDQRARYKMAKQAGSTRSMQVVPPINIPQDISQQKNTGSGDEIMADNEPEDQNYGSNRDGLAPNSDVFLRLHKKDQRRLRRQGSPRIGELALSKANSADPLSTWLMVHDKNEAHKSQVYAMTSVGNQLYSAAARSLRIWDISTMSLLSDLTDKIGVIKAISFWKERNLLLTASERNIMMWDVVSLTNVGVLKGFKEEIKALHFVPDKQLLFAASKGNGQSGGLLIYDLRKNYQSPVHEREKNQDIFSLQSTGGHIFYGCRNHHVYPFCLNTFTTLQGLQPPHFDAVTSLALLRGGSMLVSGSRDKNLRTYDLSRPNFPELTSSLNAHTDQINVLEADESQQFLYSGGRDGIVKVWSSLGQSGEIQLQESLEGNAQHSSINTICKIDTGGDGSVAFACGSSDKSIRVFRMSDQANQQMISGRADSNIEMRDTGSAQLQQASPRLESDFTATQLNQLQELELGLASLGGYNQQQQMQGAAATEESGAISQLRRRKKEKQQQMQQQSQHPSIASSFSNQ